MTANILPNYIDGAWRAAVAQETLPVTNPATGEVLAHVPLSTAADVGLAASAAQAAFDGWRRTPATARIQFLFKLKRLLEDNMAELARTITLENGKTLEESRGELARAVENVEVACGIPMLMQGDYSEDIARGIDEYMIRQPVGVCATIAPFNFPGMIAFWYLPYALACGNTFILKPAERCPMTMQRVFELLHQLELPNGVVNLVNGGPVAVDAILDHPLVRAVTFVGSTAVARHVYGRAAANGKRVQAQGGAKNPVVVLPDADLEMTTRIVADAAFGNAGQRCLAASLAITVGGVHSQFVEAIADAATNRVVGYGMDAGVEMGPVITAQSKTRIQGLMRLGTAEGARLLVDGSTAAVKGFANGSFMRPSVMDGLSPDGEIARAEIFGPVLGLIHVESVDAALEFINSGKYGNMACLFTASGASARKFRVEAQTGNIGINIGVAAPMAFFPFSGWKDSFFGDMHGQGKHAVEFFTQTKVVVERWPQEWTRKF